MSEQALVKDRFPPSGDAFPAGLEAVRSEREIILLVRSGRKEAYEVIVVKYMRAAYAIALGFVRNSQDALDASQEAFVRAFRKMKSYDPERPFFPWFYQILKHICYDQLRKKKRSAEVPLEDAPVVESDEVNREMRRLIWKGIENLPLAQREVIILRYFRQMSYREIADLTAKPLGTVMSTLFYAKKHLKDIIVAFLGSEGKKSGENDGPSKV